MTDGLRLYCPDCKKKYLCVETPQKERGFETVIISENQLHSLTNSLHGIGCPICGCKCIYAVRKDGTWGHESSIIHNKF